MLPISRRADSPTSVPASTSSSRHRLPASPSPMSSSTIACRLPSTPITTAATISSGRPQASTASARGRARARGTLISTSRDSICDSAVAAEPEAMLASSRSASSWRSVKDGVTGCAPGVGWVRRPAALRGASVRVSAPAVVRALSGLLAARVSRRSQSMIRAIRPSASAAPPETGSPPETTQGRGRVTSSRWPIRSSTASATRLSCARTMTTNACSPPSWRPNTPPPSTSGSTPSSSTSIRRPATELTVCWERRRVRSIRSSGMA